MNLFDETARARLRKPPPHSSIDQSLVSRALEPFWCWVADRMPAWVSPNAITLSGLVLVALSFAATTGLCPGFTGAAPWWAYLAAIVALFAFQTLDAVDGKQARRTKTSSALGSWLDHACDVVAIQMAMATVACSLDLGTSGLALFLMASVAFNNFVIHWETKHTGTLFMGNGTSIYEAQLTLMLTHAVTLACGQEIWHTPVSRIAPFLAGPLDVSVAAVIVVVGVGAIGGVGVIGSVRRVHAGARASGRAFAPLLAELVPVTVLCAAAAVVHARGEEGRVPFTFAASLLGLRLIAHVILEHLADLPAKRFDAALGPLVLSSLGLAVVPSALVPDGAVAALGWANLAFAVVVSGRIFVGGTREMAAVLGIPILTLPAATIPQVRTAPETR